MRKRARRERPPARRVEVVGRAPPDVGRYPPVAPNAPRPELEAVGWIAARKQPAQADRAGDLAARMLEPLPCSLDDIRSHARDYRFRTSARGMSDIARTRGRTP